MDKRRPSCKKTFFLQVIGTTPVRIAGVDLFREAIVINNEDTSVSVRIGGSGTNGTLLPPTETFSDNYSQDEWWGWTAASSGTVSAVIFRT